MAIPKMRASLPSRSLDMNIFSVNYDLVGQIANLRRIVNPPARCGSEPARVWRRCPPGATGGLPILIRVCWVALHSVAWRRISDLLFNIRCLALPKGIITDDNGQISDKPRGNCCARRSFPPRPFIATLLSQPAVRRTSPPRPPVSDQSPRLGHLTLRRSRRRLLPQLALLQPVFQLEQ